jgi:hypothetical protein
MTARNLSVADQFARAAFAEIIALRLLQTAVAADPKNASALLDGVVADLKAAGSDYLAKAKATRDAKLHRFADVLQPALDDMVKQIEALKPKA